MNPNIKVDPATKAQLVELEKIISNLKKIMFDSEQHRITCDKALATSAQSPAEKISTGSESMSTTSENVDPQSAPSHTQNPLITEAEQISTLAASTYARMIHFHETIMADLASVPERVASTGGQNSIFSPFIQKIENGVSRLIKAGQTGINAGVSSFKAADTQSAKTNSNS
jgi:hypothetical protein